MALPIVHLYVSNEIYNLGLKINDLSQFYLGVISPDAIHMRKENNRDDKNKVHFIPDGKKWMDINEIEYYDFITTFVRTNLNKTKMEFILGYGVHLLTDMHWFKEIWVDYVQKYTKDSSPIQDERSAYYNDTDIIDQLLFNEIEWRKDIWEKLKNVECNDFLNILTCNEIELWKERTLHWFDDKNFLNKHPIRYITESDIKKFVSKYSKQIYNGIKNIV